MPRQIIGISEQNIFIRIAVCVQTVPYILKGSINVRLYQGKVGKMISAVQPKDCRLEGVDLVVTGEGRTDWQSCFGKVMQGVPALSAAAMIHVGATVVDSLPHGSFFHATGGSVNMTIGDRMKLIPFEACVGLTSTIISVLLFCIIG